MGVEMFVYVLVESQASSQTSGPLRHRWARYVKNSKRQDIGFAEQVGDWAIHKLSGNLLIRQCGRVTGTSYPVQFFASVKGRKAGGGLTEFDAGPPCAAPEVAGEKALAVGRRLSTYA